MNKRQSVTELVLKKFQHLVKTLFCAVQKIISQQAC